ncbi:MAG: hypothetical protein VKO26_02290 [Cyanobacteriota bacterium]|nr:hypothetical protein [Cyanobacteriota bacterium]
MPAACPPRRHWIWLLAVVALLALPPGPFPFRPAPALAANPLPPRAYVCDGDPLIAELARGPMDDPAIPDPSAAPVPVGGWVVLRWRDLSLQLPRTNNAGQASFSDGRWWWSLEDPARPRFRLRRPAGDSREFACVEAPTPPATDALKEPRRES